MMNVHSMHTKIVKKIPLQVPVLPQPVRLGGEITVYDIAFLILE